MMREAGFISVIVPVRNEERFVESTIRQLVGQDYDPDRFEVLVVDGRSTDATRAIAEGLAARYSNVRVLDNPRRLSSGARNVGVRHARGDLIVIVDGHCELDGPGHLGALADSFARSGADCLGRPQPQDVSKASALQRAIAAARSSRLGHHPDSFIYASEERFVPPQSVAVAYRRSVFEAVGLFDESFDACEDVEFNHRVARAGLRCFFTPRIGVRYFPRSSLPGLFRQMARYGRGRVRLLRKHPETFSAPGFVPAALVLGLLVGPILSAFSPALATIYLATLAFYLAVILAASLAVAARPGQARLLPWLPLVFAAIHLGSGWGILLEAVHRPRPARLCEEAMTTEASPAAGLSL